MMAGGDVVRKRTHLVNLKAPDAGDPGLYPYLKEFLRVESTSLHDSGKEALTLLFGDSAFRRSARAEVKRFPDAFETLQSLSKTHGFLGAIPAPMSGDLAVLNVSDLIAPMKIYGVQIPGVLDQDLLKRGGRAHYLNYVTFGPEILGGISFMTQAAPELSATALKHVFEHEREHAHGESHGESVGKDRWEAAANIEIVKNRFGGISEASLPKVLDFFSYVEFTSAPLKAGWEGNVEFGRGARKFTAEVSQQRAAQYYPFLETSQIGQMEDRANAIIRSYGVRARSFVAERGL